jgi:hypothetical protein
MRYSQEYKIRMALLSLQSETWTRIMHPAVAVPCDRTLRACYDQQMRRLRFGALIANRDNLGFWQGDMESLRVLLESLRKTDCGHWVICSDAKCLKASFSVNRRTGAEHGLVIDSQLPRDEVDALFAEPRLMQYKARFIAEGLIAKASHVVILASSTFTRSRSW